MFSENRSFSYDGETVFLMRGNNLTKNELIIRLKRMNYCVDDSFDKDDLVHVYENAINKDENKIKIFNRLRKDTQYINEKNNLKNYPINLNHQNEIRNTNNKITRNIISNNENLTNYRNRNYPKNSSNIIIKFLKFLMNHKKFVGETLLVSIFAFAFENFMKRLEENTFVFGGVYNSIRNILTPRRIILGFLFFYATRYLLSVLFYYAMGIGLIAVIYLMSKGTIKEFIDFFNN